SERIGRAFSETTYETIEQLPHWATVFVVASVESTPEAARNVGSRLSGRFGRIYSLVPLEDCLTTSRRAIRPDGHGAFLTAPAGALTKTAVENAIAAGEDAGVTVVPIVVEATARDYRAMLARLATGGPP